MITDITVRILNRYSFVSLSFEGFVPCTKCLRELPNGQTRAESVPSNVSYKSFNPCNCSGVTRALIGGGVYSYIRVLPDGFLLKLSSFQKKSVGQNTNI